MPSSLNRVILIGNLGRDAETRQTASGTSVTNFSIATTERFKDSATGDWKDKTDWHDVVLWRGERVAEYLTKGKQVCVEGRLQTRSWEDRNSGEKKYKTEVVCNPGGLMLLGGRGAEGGGGSRASSAPSGGGSGSGGGQSEPAPAAEPDNSSVPPPDDDDIPF